MIFSRPLQCFVHVTIASESRPSLLLLYIHFKVSIDGQRVTSWSQVLLNSHNNNNTTPSLFTLRTLNWFVGLAILLVTGYFTITAHGRGTARETSLRSGSVNEFLLITQSKSIFMPFVGQQANGSMARITIANHHLLPPPVLFWAWP